MYNGLVNPRDRIQQIWGCFYYLMVPPSKVNSKPHLSLDEEESRVV
jgi:hypothetical protein